MPPNQTYRILYSPSAKNDLHRITKFYDENSVQAGDLFFDRFMNALEVLRADPERFPKVESRPVFRKMRLPKYPFSIYFKLYPSRLEVFVVAVFHEKRDSKALFRRLK